MENFPSVIMADENIKNEFENKTHDNNIHNTLNYQMDGVDKEPVISQSEGVELDAPITNVNICDDSSTPYQNSTDEVPNLNSKADSDFDAEKIDGGFDSYQMESKDNEDKEDVTDKATIASVSSSETFDTSLTNQNLYATTIASVSSSETFDTALTSQTLYATASAASGHHLASKKDDDERKIFVGGLHWETTIENLKEYFSTFGAILDVTLKTDISTGRSRGFGFVLFEDLSSVDKVMEQKTHVLQGKTIDPKRAVTRHNGQSGPSVSKDPCKKIFVGGISPDMPEVDIRNFFSKYGKIEEVELPFDRVKNMRRAYVFLTFESEKCAEQACLLPKQKIGEREVDVRKATPRAENQAQKAGVDFSTMYPPGYDYSQFYGSYGYPGYPGYPGFPGQAPGYDFSAYYNQDWSQYAAQYPQQYSGYPPAAYPTVSYPQGQTFDQSNYGYPPGFDYSAWYASQGQQQPPQQSGQPPQQTPSQMPPPQIPLANGQPAAGKMKQEHHAAAYHPYAR